MKNFFKINRAIEAKKKLFLFIVAAMFATSMWAQAMWPERAVETISVPVYITDIQFDASTNQISFVDNFQNDFARVRMYNISIAYRTEDSHIWQMAQGNPTDFAYTDYYDYGIEHNRNFTSGLIDHNNYFYSNEATAGGYCRFDITNLLGKAYEKGYVDVRIMVRGCYKYADTWRDYYLVDSNPASETWYIINYLDTTLPKIHTFNVSAPSTEVKYSETLQINCEIQAASNTLLTFLYYDEKESKYNEVYSYMLSAEEARQGATVSYTKSFWDDDVEAERTYRIRAYVDGSFQEAQNITINFQYPLSINSGNPSYYGAGETVNLAKQACMGYTARTTKDVPVVIEDMGDYYRLTMPACQVWLKEEAAKYTVQFRDYDNSVLKTQKVACGSDATPPSNPSHAGMTFTGWDKPFTNIHESQVIRALYTVDGVDALLSVDGTVISQGLSKTFSVYFKSPSSVAARAYMQAAWLDTEEDDLSFNDISGYTDFTKAEAAAGTTKTRDVTVLPNGTNNYGHRARYFRLRVRQSGQDYYSNIVRIDVCYPILIQSSSDNTIATTKIGESMSIAHGNVAIYSRPLDTIHVVERAASACPLRFQWQSLGYGVDAGDYWVVVPAESGENTLYITREKHQVIFYCEGLGDPYSSLMYGAGAYEPQDIECAMSATPPDVAAELPEDKLFRGWKARGDYADDAYNYVLEDMAFDAILEDAPEGIEQIPVPQDKARKYMIDGVIYLALPDGQVYNLNGLRVR